ncbi:MAG: hypothetical protein QNJ38_23550 [Prochloraceae cyanobacterium]|nr:hypothetical protein [Prochloraceae cyanobacterium]
MRDNEVVTNISLMLEKSSNWGGYRENTPEPNWHYGKTKTVRVPIALAEKVLAIARLLDMEEIELSISDEEKFKKALSSFKPGRFDEALEQLEKVCQINLKKKN